MTKNYPNLTRAGKGRPNLNSKRAFCTIPGEQWEWVQSYLDWNMSENNFSFIVQDLLNIAKGNSSKFTLEEWNRKLNKKPPMAIDTYHEETKNYLKRYD